ncbi:MAG TPA: YbhB/YbcL family Raf kinase inhibitor-like protein [Pantoea sp.]|uniref:YbhB/YbcL family Raf kinase inhibitor-like protein n=1 Tax=Pantoea TaxID=53335 RepID=UPI000BB56D3B|nr:MULTISPECIES: YbhB/YbcL family Raf kinase inhibitor-like protein [Pantoea]PNK70317.1 YbhB/YbcL family Raf kinase inhibitor-like protein [Pantoea sp. FDAARGOS_194]HAK33450.1 YbhB/YbcL family Raf kinase inhibitor-like protein [Pantoea sp.]
MRLASAFLLAALPAASFAAAPLFTLQSQDFTDNAFLPKSFAGNNKSSPACTGDNVSPALSWSNAPQDTKSFALLVTDPVGAKGLGVTHMVAYNIPAATTAFAQGDLTKGKGYTGGKNSPGTNAWYGPCPPVGSGMHHYNFVVIATDLPPEQLKPGLTHEELVKQLKGHALGAASLVGRFSNDPQE